MSKSTVEDVFAPILARYRDEQLSATFGHLHPEDQKEYPGQILFTHTEYGQHEIIRANFDGLDSSPWLFQDLNEFISQIIRSKENSEGTIWRWTGTYKRVLTPGNEGDDDNFSTEDEWNWEFTGHTRKVRVR